MRMRTSSAAGPESSVQTAWGCLTTNLAVPGAGSFLAGRKVTGVLQLALAIVGTAFTLIFSVRFFAWYASNRLRLEELGVDDPLGVIAEMWLAVRWAIIGIGMFGMSWLWALLTGLQVLKAAKRNAPLSTRPAPPKL